MIKIYHLSQPITDLKNQISNYNDIKKVVDLEGEATDYRFYNNNEILIYNSDQTMYSCSYTDYKDQLYITHIFDRYSKLVYEYSINYD